jgi:hypothetical protein
MTVLTTSLDRRPEVFAANAAAMRAARRGSAGEGRGDPRGRRGAKPLTDDERRWFRQIIQRIAALLWVLCWMRSIKKRCQCIYSRRVGARR